MHVRRLTQIHEYAVASSHKMRNGTKLVAKHQGIHLFMTPKGLSGRQKDEAILNILKEHVVKRAHLMPEGLFDDIFMPRQKGSTFPVELTNLTRQVKELIYGAIDPDPPAWDTPVFYYTALAPSPELQRVASQ